MTSQSVLEDSILRAKEHEVLVQKTFPYRIVSSPHLTYLSMWEWCTEQFEKQWDCDYNPNGIWTELPHPGCRRWYFKNEKDAMLFALRWS